MRSINATLTTNQAFLYGRPAHSLIIGNGPTYDASADLVGYVYNERSQLPGEHLIYLDNSASTYNSLTGDQAPIEDGAIIELERGLTVAGTDYTAELPRLYIEGMDYQYGDGRSLFVLRCLDMWDRLHLHRIATKQTWSATSATTILEWILTQLGFTRASGSMTALTIDFEITTSERMDTAIRRLMTIMPEYLYFGTDAEIKWKELDPAEASDYTVGWNANHPVLAVNHAESQVWEINTVTVNGAGAASNTQSDSGQIALVGNRRITVHDITLTTNGECEAAAEGILAYYEARAQEVIITCRPIHGLEMYDILTLSSPPWGGANVVGRVVAIREEYNTKQGRWQQRITLGYPSQYTYLARDGSTILNIDAANVIAHDLAQITQYTGALSVDGILKLVTDGVLHSGQTAYNTGTGFWLEYNSGTPRLSIGDATNEKITWDGTTLTVEGDLTAGSGNPVYPMVPLTAPLTSAAWDEDSFSTTAKTKIDLSDVFSAPAGIKAVLVEVEIRDSASAANDCYLILAPNHTAGQGIAFTCPAVDDRRGRFCALVPCDGSGDIYYQIVASGASTFDIKLEIWGYLI